MVEHFLTFAPEGSLIEYSPRGIGVPARRGSRGEVAGFSVRSRSRLNKKLAMIKKHLLPCFVTLTYHEDYPLDFEGYKMDLHYFSNNLLSKFHGCSFIWKLEFQERGAPHYHLMVWGVSESDLRSYIPEMWHKIAGNGSELHLAWHKGELGNGNENCVNQIRSWNGVKSYASKYMSKMDDDTKRGGRIWGSRGSLPLSLIQVFKVSLETALLFRKKIMLERNYQFQRLGFWCSDFSADWFVFLWQLWELDYEVPPPEDRQDWDVGLYPEDFLQ